MLDFNLLLFREASSKQGKFPPEGSGGSHVYDSGSSNSSVFNAEGCSITGDEDSSRSAFQFDILNAYTGGEEDEVELDGVDHGFGSEVCSLTRQLFPPSSPASVPGVIKAARSTSFLQGLIDFRFCQADSSAMAEVKLLHSHQPQKSRRGPRSRSSQYRGVTFYRRTGRWESHIWDCGKQIYLGGFDTAHAAARAYDRAAIKFRGVEADINFNLSDYEEDMKQMKNLSKDEFVHILRRQRTGFSKGSSKFRGVALHKCGRWEARMGQFLGKKAHAKAAIKCNGREAVANFEPSVYERELLPQDDGEAAGHDIDLNLSISQPSMCNSKRVDNQTGIQLQCGSFETFNVNEIKIDYPSSIAIVQPHHLALASEHPQARTNVFPDFFTISEGSTASKKMLTGSLLFPAVRAKSIAPLRHLNSLVQHHQDSLRSAGPHHLQLLPRATTHNFWN